MTDGSRSATESFGGQTVRIPDELPGLFARLGDVDRSIALTEAMSPDSRAGALVTLAGCLPALASPEQARRVADFVWSAASGEFARTWYQDYLLFELAGGLAACSEEAEALRVAEQVRPHKRLLWYARFAIILARRGDRTGARELAERARALESGIADDLRTSATTGAVVRALVAAGEVEAALDFGCRSLGHRDLKVLVARTAAVVGDKDTALATGKSADVRTEVSVLSEIASVVARSGDTAEARALVARAQESQNNVNEDFRRKDVTSDLALALGETGNAAAITWAHRIADNRCAAGLLAEVASALAAAGEVEAARSAADGALERLGDVAAISSMSDRLDAERVLLEIACAYIAVGDTATAQRLAEPITRGGKARVQMRLASAMAATGQKSAALATAERALALALADSE